VKLLDKIGREFSGYNILESAKRLRDRKPLQCGLYVTDRCLLHRVRQQLGRIRASTIKKMDTGNCRARRARALNLISFFKLAGCSNSDGRKQPSFDIESIY
jgi:hypothetical protein